MRKHMGRVVRVLFPSREARRDTPYWWLGLYFACCLVLVSAGVLVSLLGAANSLRAVATPLVSPEHWKLLLVGLWLEMGGVLLAAGGAIAVLVGWVLLFSMVRSTLQALCASLASTLENHLDREAPPRDLTGERDAAPLP